jgi:hypothetical protein
MSLSKVQLSLLIGQTIPMPAPRLLMNALESVQVNDSAAFTQGFQLTFRAERELAPSVEYALLNSPLLRPGCRVIITVTLNAMPRVLVDGIITQHQLVPGGGAQGTSLTVTGEDISVLMDMAELDLPYPPLPHVALVMQVLLRYAAFGVVPLIIPPLSDWTTNPLGQTSFQKGTDRAYLRTLAGQHGFIFGVKPGPLPFANIAYWGPPGAICQISRICPPQAPLSIDMGPNTNVESISFSYNSLAPERIHGIVADPDIPLPVPVLSMVSTRVPYLASRPALAANGLFVRSVMQRYEGHNAVEAWALAQARTNEASDEVVSASGTLNTLRYGSLLSAPGIVGLRGAGYSYDGYYMVKSVSHTINRNEYRQSFTLAREGTGSLTQRV